MIHSQAITAFQRSCQEYFVCYAAAVNGLEEAAGRFAKCSPNKCKFLMARSGHRDDGIWHASMNIGRLLESSVRGGNFSDMIAKAFLIAIYSHWDEHYRELVANEVGVSKGSVLCDLMGDVRHIRNCIVHAKSIVRSEHNKIIILKWQLSPGPLRITEHMFRDFIDQVNMMQVRIKPPTVEM